MEPGAMGRDLPASERRQATVESLTEAEKLFDAARETFAESAPDLSKITRCMEDLRKEMDNFSTDFGIILREDPRYGGGLEQQGFRVEGMRQAIAELNFTIAEAESILDTNEFIKGLFRGQVDAAKAAVAALEKI